jgi:hypothetical protein
LGAVGQAVDAILPTLRTHSPPSCGGTVVPPGAAILAPSLNATNDPSTNHNASTYPVNAMRLNCSGSAAFQPKRPTNHSADQERVAYLKIQTKDEFLAELMAEHIALKKTLGKL